MFARRDPGGAVRLRRRGRPWLLAVMTAGALGLAACNPGDEHAQGVRVQLAFEPAPRVGLTTCTVRLEDADGAPLGGAALEVEGNMNHAGMVPVFGAAEETSPGVYQAPLEFTMGGDWFVIVRGELSDGRRLEEILEVPGVAMAGAESGGDASSCCPQER